LTSASDHAFRVAQRRGLIPPGSPAGAGGLDRLIAAGTLDAAALARVLAEEAGCPVVELDRLVVPRAVLALLPRASAERYTACPVALEGEALRVAVGDPLDLATLDALAHVTGRRIIPGVAPAAAIRAALARHHGWGAPGAVEEPAASPGGTGDEDAPIILLVHQLIAEAVRRRASDIHLEPLEHRFRVRYRVDGVLQEGASPPRAQRAAIVSRVKILANLSIAERRVPQDGRLRLELDGRALDLRVATLPTAHGESVVLRLLDHADQRPGLAELGLAGAELATFENLLAVPDGLILVTGPTGSGKTTTLYAALERLNDRDRKLITVEDPVEYQMTGVNQVPVNAATGLTFAAALRAMLRQAPNVIMVGEIRDRETAEIAVNAALTGHLVLSTLHTNDAPGAVTRLLDLGVKPFLAAAALRAVLAQRLVRRVCAACARTHTPGADERRLLGLERPPDLPAACARGAGCAACGGTGYRGRLGLFEVLVLDDGVRAAIHDSVTTARVRAAARRSGWRTLREDGQRKVLAGLTTIEEVAAVTFGDPAST